MSDFLLNVEGINYQDKGLKKMGKFLDYKHFMHSEAQYSTYSFKNLKVGITLRFAYAKISNHSLKHLHYSHFFMHMNSKSKKI